MWVRRCYHTQHPYAEMASKLLTFTFSVTYTHTRVYTHVQTVRCNATYALTTEWPAADDETMAWKSTSTTSTSKPPTRATRKLPPPPHLTSLPLISPTREPAVTHTYRTTSRHQHRRRRTSMVTHALLTRDGQRAPVVHLTFLLAPPPPPRALLRPAHESAHGTAPTLSGDNHKAAHRPLRVPVVTKE